MNDKERVNDRTDTIGWYSSIIMRGQDYVHNTQEPSIEFKSAGHGNDCNLHDK